MKRDDDEEVEYEELPPTEMIASSGPMVEIYKTISLVAPKDTTVLVEGETGTGKELLARMIHRYSTALGPALHCGRLRRDRAHAHRERVIRRRARRLHRIRPRPRRRVRSGESRHGVPR